MSDIFPLIKISLLLRSDDGHCKLFILLFVKNVREATTTIFCKNLLKILVKFTEKKPCNLLKRGFDTSVFLKILQNLS